jgi:hypothetical protein
LQYLHIVTGWRVWQSCGLKRFSWMAHCQWPLQLHEVFFFDWCFICYATALLCIAAVISRPACRMTPITSTSLSFLGCCWQTSVQVYLGGSFVELFLGGCMHAVANRASDIALAHSLIQHVVGCCVWREEVFGSKWRRKD